MVKEVAIAREGNVNPNNSERRGVAATRRRTDDDYYRESKRLRAEALEIAEQYKDNPLRFSISNVIDMDVEITKADIKTIVSKASNDNKFNAVKNALARDIPGYLRKAEYAGYRETEEGKHNETAYFTYFNRRLAGKTYLAMRRMKDGGYYKPYAIMSEQVFNAKIGNLKKEKPPV